MNLSFALVLVMGSTLVLSASCTFSKKKEGPHQGSSPSSKTPAASTALVQAPTPLSPLIGNWTACESSSSDTLQISGITHYQIKDEQNMTVTFRYYSDTACKVPFTETDATKAIKAWEDFYKEKAQDDVKDYYRSLIEGFTQDSTYIASMVAPGEIGTFDQTTHYETAYLSYKIVDGKLFITEACLPSEIVAASEKNCTVIGESAEHRSTDFSPVLPFEKI